METEKLTQAHPNHTHQSDAPHPCETCLTAKDILGMAGKAIIVLFAIQGLVASARELREAVAEWRHVRAAERRWKRLAQEEEKALRQS